MLYSNYSAEEKEKELRRGHIRLKHAYAVDLELELCKAKVRGGRVRRPTTIAINNPFPIEEIMLQVYMLPKRTMCDGQLER